jgi:hypothetical protein
MHSLFFYLALLVGPHLIVQLDGTEQTWQQARAAAVMAGAESQLGPRA